MYMVYFMISLYTVVQNEVISYCFENFPSDLQFLVIFMIKACRELEFFTKSKLMEKMIGDQKEQEITLLTITLNGHYGLFIAIRLTGANLTTICCILAIDFFFHLKATYEVIKEHRKVVIEETEHANSRKSIYTTQLVVSELMEGFIPITYGVCMVMAYYGPNATMLTNIGSTYWGEKIADIDHVLVPMAGLLLFDTISVVVTSFVLWKVANLKMLQEFRNSLDKYWLFFLIKLGKSMSKHFALTDINFGMDITGNFDWITPEGRLSLIYNSTEPT